MISRNENYLVSARSHNGYFTGGEIVGEFLMSHRILAGSARCRKSDEEKGAFNQGNMLSKSVNSSARLLFLCLTLMYKFA
jgi:hypothetical protein